MAAFRVDVEPDVSAVVRDKKTPKDVRTGITSAYTRLEAKGCAAASYRLSGAGEHPRYCVVKLPRNWRLSIEFPALDEVLLSFSPSTGSGATTGPHRSRTPPRTWRRRCTSPGAGSPDHPEAAQAGASPEVRARDAVRSAPSRANGVARRLGRCGRSRSAGTE